jgi:TatD DNase family protein
MIDIALNLDNARFDADREAVVLRAQEAGVSALILTGTTASRLAAARASQARPIPIGPSCARSAVYPMMR